MAALQDAIQKLVGAESQYLETAPVIEKFHDKTVWQGVVYVFRLLDHPQAHKCYAWHSDNPETGKRKYYAVLHIPPIDSPEKAVRAAIVQDFRATKS